MICWIVPTTNEVNRNRTILSLVKVVCITIKAITIKRLQGKAASNIFFSSLASSVEIEGFLISKIIMNTNNVSTKISCEGPLLRYLRNRFSKILYSKLVSQTYVCWSVLVKNFVIMPGAGFRSKSQKSPMYLIMTTAKAETLESLTIIVSDTSRIEPPLKMTKALMVRKYR